MVAMGAHGVRIENRSVHTLKRRMGQMCPIKPTPSYKQPHPSTPQTYTYYQNIGRRAGIDSLWGKLCPGGTFATRL